MTSALSLGTGEFRIVTSHPRRPRRTPPVDSDSGWTLVAAYQAGDPTAAARFYREYYPVVHRMLVGMRGRQFADEWASEVFVRALSRLATVRPDSPSPTAWLRMIATNLVIDIVRREQRRPETLTDEPPERPTSGGDDPVGEQAATAATVEMMLRHLPPDQRALILNRHARGLSTAQMAAELGTSESIVKARLYRAMRAVRRALFGNPDDPDDRSGDDEPT